MNKLLAWLRSEPVAVISGVVTAGMDCGVAFGLHLSHGQEAAVLAVGSALLALIARGQVTPTTTPTVQPMINDLPGGLQL